MDDPADLFVSEQVAEIVRQAGGYVADKPDDRRTRRSKAMLQQALVALIGEKRFDKISVQEIVERAGLGRTTFYAHFQSKEDLFLSSHEEIITAISCSFFTDHGSLRTEPSSELVQFLEMGHQGRAVHFFLTWGSGGEIIRLLKERIAGKLAEQLNDLFEETETTIPFEILAQHVAGSMVSVMSWWLDKRTPYSAHEVAAMVHQMNQATLRRALGNEI
jgi:AcrR family transcriptional regulator